MDMNEPEEAARVTGAGSSIDDPDFIGHYELEDYLANSAGPVEVETIAVLGMFGRERRGSAVNREIREYLIENDLDMLPSIEDADYYGTVQLSRRPEDDGKPADDSAPAGPELANPKTAGPSTAPLEDSRTVLSSLKADKDGNLDFLTFGMTAEQAAEKMHTSGRSKMPLFWDENARDYIIGTVRISDLTFDRADSKTNIVDLAQLQVPIVSTDEHLLDAIPIILENGFVYGRGANGTIVQIYTVADVSSHLNSLAQMFIRANSIEDRLRTFLQSIPEHELKRAKRATSDINSIVLNHKGETLSEEELAGQTGEGEHIVHQFTFADYMKIFADQGVWDTYIRPSSPGSDLSREKCIRSLNLARKARNSVMHGTKPEHLEALLPSFKLLESWIKNMRPLKDQEVDA